jgi:hypothetical protein
VLIKKIPRQTIPNPARVFNPKGSPKITEPKRTPKIGVRNKNDASMLIQKLWIIQNQKR